jgi:hypothetical protein
MNRITRLLTFVAAMSLSSTVFGADIHRSITAELDPVAPSSSAYEEQNYGVTTNKWGGQVDFNVNGVLSTGPELWVGNFIVRGSESTADDFRREDFYPGERHKLDATRLRWNLTKWERPSSMRGWYLKGGYSYTRVNSRANRYSELTGDEAPAGSGSSDGIPVGVFKQPDDETDLITDIRHGVYGGFGQRWIVASRMTITLGTSVTANLRRAVTIDSNDPDARADYDVLVEDLPSTRISVRPTPEANLTFGYNW